MNRLLASSALAILLMTGLFGPAQAVTPGPTTCEAYLAANGGNYDPSPVFNDNCYHQGVWYSPDTTKYDVLILPPASHQELREWQLVEQSVDNWENGIKALGPQWLRDGLQVNDYTVGHEFVPADALEDPEVIVVLHANVMPLGTYAGAASLPPSVCHGVTPPAPDSTAWHRHAGSAWGHSMAACNGGGRVCLVTDAATLDAPNANERRVNFDLVSHEVGHCLTLGHVGDADTEDTDDSVAYPEHDIMSYENDGLHASTMHCPSNLNVMTIAKAFGALLGQPGATTAVAPNPASFVNMRPSTWSAPACPQSEAVLGDIDYLTSADPLAEDVDQSQSSESVVPRVSILDPADGASVDDGLPFAVAGVVDRTVVSGSSTSTSSSSSSTTTTSGSSTTTTTSSTTSSTGPPPPATCVNDAVSDVAVPDAPGIYDISRACAQRTATDLVVKITTAGRTRDDTLANVDSPVYYTIFTDTHNPMGVYGSLGVAFGGDAWLVRDDVEATGCEECHAQSDGTALTVTLPLSVVGPATQFQVQTSASEGVVGLPLYSLVHPGFIMDLAPNGGKATLVGFNGPFVGPLAPGRASLTIVGPPAPPALAAGAPSAAPPNAQVTDVAGDALSQQTQHDIRAAWFSEDAGNLYVGLKVEDIPADATTTVQTLYAVNFKPKYATTWTGVPAAGTFDGLRAYAAFAPANAENPGATTTEFKLQALWTETSGSKYGEVADLSAGSSLDPATDILWWVIPKTVLANGGAHPASGDKLEALGAGTGLNVGAGTLNGVDSAESATTFTFGAAVPSERVEVYEGAARLAVSAGLDTSGADEDAAWSTQVTLSGAGQHTLTAKWMEPDGTVIDTDTVTVQVGSFDPCEGAAAPVLSALEWYAGSTNVSISWQTDVDATTQVDYGVGSLDRRAVDESATRWHSIWIGGLEPGTTYDYVVTSNACGWSSSSPAGNQFTTPADGASVTIGRPAEGSVHSGVVEMSGSFDASAALPRHGTGLTEANSAAWAADLREVLASKSWRKAEAKLDDLPGFVAAVPSADGKSATVHLAGDVPAKAAAKVGGWRIEYVGHSAPQTLRHELAPEEAAGMVHHTVEEALAEWSRLNAAEPAGPAAPGIQEGIGPGSALQQGNYICSASYLFQDPADPAQYYLSTAGHCLLKAGNGVGKTGATTPNDVYGTVSVCYAGCVMNGVGLGTYVDFTASGSYHPVAFASASPTATDADGIGRDFGLIKVPKSANPLLRGWMTQWGGPDGSSGTIAGDLMAIYGHGTHCCIVVGVTTRTPADQGRLLVSGGQPGDGSFMGYGWTSGGDSGGAIGIATQDGDKVVRASRALGVNTHGIITGGILDGTLLSKGIAMVDALLGFEPVLVKADDAIVSGTGGAQVYGASIVSPGPGSTFDKSEVSALVVSGVASFPAASGAGTESTTYYLHRKGCGNGQDNTVYMDNVKGTGPDAGDGCASLLAPAGPAADAAGAGLVDEFTATPAPAAAIDFDLSRKVHVDVRANGDAAPARALGDFEGELVVDGVVVAQKRITTATGGDFNVAMDLDWVAGAPRSAPRGSDLAFRFATHQSASVTYVQYGGDQGSRISIPLAATPVDEVQVSVDDASFASGLLDVAGTTSWTSVWDLAAASEGEHTLYARILQDGVPVAGQAVASRAFTVSGEVVEPDQYTVQVRVTEGFNEVQAYTDATVTFVDGRDDAGSWSYDWTPPGNGSYKMLARLMLGDEVVATSESRAFMAGGSTGTSTSTSTSTSSTSNTGTSSGTSTTSPPMRPADLQGISPTFGTADGGTLVTLSGRDFNPDAVVLFNGALADEITYVDDTHLTARTPPGIAGTRADVTVIQAGGNDTLAQAYRYTGSGGGSSSTTTSSGSAGGEARNGQPVVLLEALAGADDLRNDGALALPFAGTASDANGCQKLSSVTALLLRPDDSDVAQDVAFSVEAGDCGVQDATRAFTGTIELPAGTPAGTYLLQVTASDGVLTGSDDLVFTVRVPNVLEFSYSEGGFLDFGSFSPGAQDVATRNLLIVENTDDLTRQAWFDIADFIGPGEDPDTIALVDNMHLQVMMGYAGDAFEPTDEFAYDATSVLLGELAPGARLAVRLVIDQVPHVLDNGAYTSTFAVTEG